MSRGKRERLGRGLGALLGEYLAPEEGSAGGETRSLPVGQISPNPYQPRRRFSQEEIQELALSIQENGLLQPILVRPSPTSEDRWELVAGERRLRAVASLGWPEIPALVREVDDRALLVLALVENLQRAELGPLEEAEGYRVLVESFGLTHGEVAKAVGKDRTTVANALRLLRLPPSVRRLVADGLLSAGHARTLAGLPDPARAAELARRAVEGGWTVRRLEEAVRGEKSRGGGVRTNVDNGRDPVLAALEDALQSALDARVVVKRVGKQGGTITIPFRNTEDFERLFTLLTGKEAGEILA